MREVEGKGVDRLGQGLDRHPDLDRQDAFVDRSRGVRHGHGGAGELTRPPVDHDRDVPELRFDRVTLGRLRKVGDELEGVEARVACLVEGHADRRAFGLRVGGTREGPVVGFDRLAECHPDRELALVVTLVRMQLRAGCVAGHPQPVCDAQPAVVRDAVALRGVEPVVLQPQPIQPEIPPDGEQDHVAFHGRSVVELDHVRPVVARPGARSLRAGAGPDRDAVAHEGFRERLCVPRVVGRQDARPGLADRGRHAEAGKDLGELHARRSAAEHQQRPRQLPRQGRLVVRPRPGIGEAVDRRHLRTGPGRDDDVVGVERHDPVGAVHLDLAPADDPGRAAERLGAGLSKRLDMAGVVRFRGVRGAVDHVVAPG
jgi:hypothetical protein